LEYHNKALEFVKKKNKTFFLQYIYHDIGLLYIYQNKFPEAMEYFLEAKKYFKSTDIRAIIISETNIATCYCSLKDYKKALDVQLALEKYPMLLETPFYSELHFTSLKDIYNGLKQYDKALIYYKKAILCSKENNNNIRLKKISNLQAIHAVKQKEQEAEIYRLKNIELVESNEKLAMHQEHLKMVNRILRHDLINQISSALSAFNLLKNEFSEDYLKEGEIKVTKSLELINRMRDLEEFMLHRLDLKPYKLNEVIQKIIDSHQNIELQVDGSAEVLADDAIYSVFENLIANAQIHGKAKKVKITIEPQANYCQIQVADDGGGISDEIKEKVFDEFFTHGENAQTGIGLFIVKKAIERYGGFVYILDNKPKGAVFVIKLKQVS
jgi:signal transduction histidine kinase